MSINIKDPLIQVNAYLRTDEISAFDINKIKEQNNKSVELIFDEKVDNGLEILKKIEGILEVYS